ncbi:uncharacterized protein SAPINGB_P001996 [Magnusiomyces paraingens]|uniref:Uncharacterized protein n=1 Tax=Magnusiomyces paraingens TaxID=2606893 RepID=A0A5E8BH95_9ASCO|nr:uncharacterized protein SAPINGB_P001996 [Saprochaete ingens]VVT48881.1 unnamed protein product [Saprochaete ingens]
MGLFRRGNKNNDDPIQVGRLDPSVDPGTNKHHIKTRSQDVHDPVLTAIHDEEPFQMSANTQGNMATVSPDLVMRDIFGNAIEAPDRSNPTRPRNERPLDTIRGFEYLCTGDERLREEMETSRFGWNPRPNFSSNVTYPHFDSNPYAAAGVGNSGDPMSSYGASSGDNNAPFKTYNPNAAEPKKKRKLFGRKKKQNTD